MAEDKNGTIGEDKSIIRPINGDIYGGSQSGIQQEKLIEAYWG